MRVLMFGWEFPPHIAGGLGTACEGIVKGLAYNGVETLFVMPSASGDEDQSATTIINASDVEVDTVSESVEEYLDKVKFIHIGTNMVPYADPEILHLAAALRLHHVVEVLRIQIGDHIGADVDEFNLVEILFHRSGNRVDSDIAGIDDPRGALILVPGCGRHHENGFDTVGGQSLDDAFAGRPESAGDMGREFPAEH